MRDVFRTLDLNLLRVFAALMAEGNVTRAARRLSLTQPAVSNALGRLRDALGDPLFEKVTTGVRPTPRAHELWVAIQPHFEAMRQAISPDRFDPAQYDGVMTVAMSDYTVARVLPRLAAHLDTQAPSLRINIVPYSVAQLPTLFEREGVDLALGAYLNDSSPLAGIRTHALWPIHTRCLMRSGHPLAKGRLTLQRYLGARHLDVRLPGMHVPLYDSLLAGHGVHRNLVLTINSYEQALTILRDSDCIGTLPVSLLDTSPAAAGLVARDPPIAMPVRQLGLIWHQRRDNEPAHRWLRTALVGLFAQPL